RSLFWRSMCAHARSLRNPADADRTKEVQMSIDMPFARRHAIENLLPPRTARQASPRRSMRRQKKEVSRSSERMNVFGWNFRFRFRSAFDRLRIDFKAIDLAQSPSHTPPLPGALIGANRARENVLFKRSGDEVDATEQVEHPPRFGQQDRHSSQDE